ncbi:MAG TPA: addiction module antidote protein, HigA family [Verrucomicrobiales bacterium]|nr:addiction module antidote protein, HigA family [Verrucomicrobiales bacterium]HRJ08485.1 HigA family addiction module antitoxin [Prosthecobacter sp.]HRK15821.1 HigA family addiction module antitoxin [Prosthecobacter sp.]
MKTTPAKESPTRLASVHPGRILKKEILEARALSQTQLAAATGLPVSRINDLVKERRGITVDSAIRLSKALGTSVDLWLNLQRAFDLEEAQRLKGEEYQRITPLAA